jgi:hypothetical protein
MAWEVCANTPYTATFKDFGGKSATFLSHLGGLVTDPAAGEALATTNALIDVSDCALVAASVEPFAVWDAPVTPATAPYDRVQDKLQIVLRSEDGSPVLANLPTFIAGVLAPDKLRVDFTNAAIIALVNYITSNLCNTEGKPITGAIRGFKRRPPRLKKD